MKNYILMLGVASVALGSYCAYAGNSATMTVTATIAHDVSLTKTRDLSLGTITINPATEEETYWFYSDSGVYRLDYGDGIVSASNATVGTFTANIPNPSACNTGTESCGGLSITGNYEGYIDNLFGGSDGGNSCDFHIKYSGTENSFNVFPDHCWIDENKMSSVTTGSHTGTLTISYTPS
ncbi:MAG: hypothetical protein IJ689_00870 [Alphaproteobacteria bacterium]|nr:hypothetical protein [Alphaproteobacteria bacterium]